MGVGAPLLATVSRWLFLNVTSAALGFYLFIYYLFFDQERQPTIILN